MSDSQTPDTSGVDNFVLAALSAGVALDNLREAAAFADKLPCLDGGHRAHGVSRGRLAAIVWLVRVCVSAPSREISE